MRFIHQIKDLQANTLAEFDHTLEFISENVPYMRLSDRKSKICVTFCR